MRPIFLVLLLALGAAAQDRDLAAMAGNVKDYATKFRLIAIGRPAVPHLMPQVAGEDAWLAFESASALRWIATHEKDRAALAADLVPWCAPDRAAPQRALAAELLGDLAVPASVRLLSEMVTGRDEAVSRAAVDALRRIPDPAAGDALVALLAVPTAHSITPASLTPLRGRILRALGARRDRRVLPVLLEAARDGDADAVVALGDAGFAEAEDDLSQLHKAGKPGAFDALVRVGAASKSGPLLARAYHLAGDDGQRGAVLRAAAELTTFEPRIVVLLDGAQGKPELRAAAQRAMLAHAAVADRADAGSLVRTVLSAPADPGLLQNAMAACARLRDPQAVELIAPHLESQETSVRLTAVAALRELPGEAATAALVDALGRETDVPTKQLIIAALGERSDRAAAPALARLLADPQVGASAAAAYVRIADALPPTEARPMYLAALEVGPSVAALRGLKRAPDAGLAGSLAPYWELRGSPYHAEALDLLVRIAGRVAAEGDRGKAVELYRKALDEGAAVANRLRELGEQVEFTARDGVVSAWWMIGPFAAPTVESWATAEFPERGVDLEKGGPGGLAWRPVETGDADGVVELDALFKPNNQVTAYAYAEIDSRKERDAILKVGSDDGIRVWLNGELVHANHALRGCTPGEDPVKVHLKEGPNALLVKICEMHGGWAFCAALYDDQGRPLKFRIR